MEPARLDASCRGRFAPSPSGDLHLGSLLAALGSWLCARKRGGAWRVRIDDIDPPREVPGSAASILRALHACALEPDAPPLYQSTRLGAYESAFLALREQGHAYPCWCSRTDLAAFAGIHPDYCTARSDAAREPAWRVRVGTAVIEFADALQGPQRWNLTEMTGDFVVKRADGLIAYQLACAVDDAAPGITDVVRGADLLDSTPRQILLQRLLGLRSPRYLHLPVLVGSNGAKLSKSCAAAALDPADPLPAMRTVLSLLGVRRNALAATTPSALLASALAAFDPAHLPRAGNVACPGAAQHDSASTLANNSVHTTR